MAYNYFPATYSPYQPAYNQPYQQMFQQPVMQQPQIQQPQQMQTSNSIIWVANEKEAAMYPIAPNNAVTLWSQSEPVVYLKQADASGKPTMKIYDLVERSEGAQNGASGAGAKTPDYATKDELAAIVTAIKGIDGVVAGVRSDIETIKGDMYGIAGKKKTSKKVEEAEDNG
jgi:hypothetical protein